MYLNFFGLKEQPFGVTPDPRFLYLSEAHKEALGVSILRHRSQPRFHRPDCTARHGQNNNAVPHAGDLPYIGAHRIPFQTHCNSREFMRLLLAELGCEEDTQDLVRMYDQFNTRLLKIAEEGNRLIVVVDEAQNLEPEVLETLRLLSNFETSTTKLMHIVLAGQPALAQKLSTPGLAQLRQRISIVQGLAPLPTWEVKNYVEHRLRTAGYRGAPIFVHDVYDSISKSTEGIPRNINNFCFNALSLACALRKRTVDSELVKEVLSDLDLQKLTWVTAAESPAIAPLFER